MRPWIAEFDAALPETGEEDETSQEQILEVSGDERAWYVVHCYSAREQGRHNLEQLH